MEDGVKVWIPGGRGMLGRAVHALLSSRGVEVVVTGHELDIADEGVVEAFVRQAAPTHVINCAAHTAVDRCESEEASAMRTNGVGPGVLGAAAHRRHAFAVHISTDYVFAGDATRAAEQRPYLEDDAVGPASVYGRSKLEGERRFLAAVQGEGAVVRTSWVFGPGGKNFVETMLRLMGEREELRVVDDQIGRPTFTPDLAAAVVALSERRLAGVWHFANTGATSWHGFATAILEEAQRRGLPTKTRVVHPIPTSAYPTPARRPAWSVLATEKIEGVLGARPRAWSEALAAYLDVVGLG
jgi:dTDP-4-dehydrorhamnose reductase